MIELFFSKTPCFHDNKKNVQFEQMLAILFINVHYIHVMA